MIVYDRFKDHHTKEDIDTINDILKRIIPDKVKNRNHGFGPKWNDEKEADLQKYLDEIEEKYDFNFRLVYASTTSLFKDDYKKYIVYR